MSPALVALYRHGFIGPSLSSEVPGPCSGDTFHASPGKCLDCCFFPIIDWNIPLPIVTGSCNRSEVLPFSRNVFYFSCPLPRCGRATHLFSLHLLLSLIWAAGSPFVHSTIALERLVTTPLLMSFNVTEANQGPDIPFFFFPPPARLDPLPPATSKLLSGLTSWAWTTVGYRKIHETRLEGVKTSAFPTTASTVNTRDTPPVLEEALFPRALSLLGHGHRFRSRTLLSLLLSSRCTHPQERS